MKPSLLALAILLLLARSPRAEEQTFDVVVVGGTPGGIAAATSAGREGLSVALVEATYQVGGMNAAGMAHTDFKTFQSLGGFWKEFEPPPTPGLRREGSRGGEKGNSCSNWRHSSRGSAASC